MGRNPQTVALIFADVFKEDAKTNIKTITIRKGWRDYKSTATFMAGLVLPIGYLL